MMTTATAPDGVIHDLDTDALTICGMNAAGWSRAVTNLQRLGLVLHCLECRRRPADELHAELREEQS